ncbi:phosphomannomutase/phosphoglucomutase [Candidatus Dependentiae bacterium]|nr:phosphomannomutase/phosphoglucomutase [Candidatus Dependentiae bacterium]
MITLEPRKTIKRNCSPNIFREYDIRGVVETEIPVTETAGLTTAILTYFLQQNPTLNKIIIGADGRTHSPVIKKNIITTATDLGLDVVDIGLCPTPVFYFSLFNTGISSGLMITASHNPGQYNGIKICLNKKSVWGKQIQEIKNIYEKKSFYKNKNRKNGSISNYNSNSHYIQWLSNHFAHLKNLSINAVIDCGNGAAGAVMPDLVKTMGWKNVKLLYEDIDGTFPNHEADPTTIKNMLDVRKLLTKDDAYTVGLGLDGDCDRMNPMTKSGYLVPGDQLLALYAKKITKEFPKAPIVFDIKSSQALTQALESYGAVPCIAPSGHSIIKEHMRLKNAKLAGELSCHFFFNDRYFGYDDGIYAALRLFELLQESRLSLDEMLNTLPQKISSPEYRIACAEEDKKNIVSHVKKTFTQYKQANLITIDGVRAQMPHGWGLIRASNTQPVICLRFEADTTDELIAIRTIFEKALEPYFSKQQLRIYFEE